VLNDFAQCSFRGLKVAFGIQELLSQGSQRMSGISLNFCKFGIDNRQGLSFADNFRMSALDFVQSTS
jgi:hypothetical protein